MKDDSLSDVNPRSIGVKMPEERVLTREQIKNVSAQATKLMSIDIPTAGGYCHRCDTVWASPGKCNCGQLLTKHEPAINVYAKELWNGAIAKCVGIVENANLRQFEKETLIKYMKEERQ